MEIFADTIDINELKTLQECGIIDGVTTNPSLMSASTRNIEDLIKEICLIVKGPVSVEVISTNFTDMLKEAYKILKIADNIVIKLPITLDGIKTCRILSSENIKTNMTLCFSVGQALLVAKAGATYVSPFVGRLDDQGNDGMKLIQDIKTMYSHYEHLNTKVLVASVRNLSHIYKALLLGAESVTAPPKIIRELANHYLTDKGLNKFLEDWKKVGKKFI